MKFYGKNEVIWDVENKRELGRFIKGEFETEDKRVIEILIKAGYKHEEVEEKTPRKRKG